MSLITAVVIALAGLSWWLATDDERKDLFLAASLFAAALGPLVAVIGLRANTDPGPAVSLDHYQASLAIESRSMAAKEKAVLRLSGSDYIQVEWSLDAGFLGGRDVTVKHTMTRNLATLSDDWRAHRPRLTVILGPKGAGKSATAVLLTHQLLTQRPEHDQDDPTPVPVLLHIGAWNPDIALPEWIARRLAGQYRLPRANGSDDTDIALRLVNGGHLIAVLDGFDELPEPRRGAALARLREAMDASQARFVLTSRIGEFATAMEADGRPFERMSVVTLRPVSPEKARTYLEEAGAGAEHWDAVVEQLHQTDSPVAQALTTPLMVFLCREVYRRHKPDRRTFEGFCDRAAVEQHLISHFLPMLYPDKTERSEPGREAERAVRYLRFVAQHMKRTRTSTFAWWQLERSLKPRTIAVAGGLTIGLAAGLAFGLMFGLTVGLTVGLGCGLIAGLAVRLAATERRNSSSDISAPQRLVLDAKTLLQTLAGGLMLGLVFGLVFSLGDEAGLGLTVWLGLGLVFGLGLGLTAGVRARQSPARLKYLSPRDVLADSRKTAIVSRLGYGLTWGLILGLMFGLRLGLGDGLRVGVSVGLIVGLIVMAGEDRWFAYRLSHLLLSVPGRRRLPGRFMTFLEQAHQQGVLRQAGATFEFRHEALQTYLSRSYDPDPSKNPAL